jgi:molybdate transport system regulatory protein
MRLTVDKLHVIRHEKTRNHQRTLGAGDHRMRFDTVVPSGQLSLKSKVWLELKGRPVIGEGRVAMLEAIHQHRSILQASRQTGISYRRIRGAIRDMETAVGKSLVVTQRGGRHGGQAELTVDALALLEAFKQLTDGFQDQTDGRFKALFK